MGLAEMIARYEKASNLIIDMVKDCKIELKVPESEKHLFENETDLAMLKFALTRYADFDYDGGIIFIKV